MYRLMVLILWLAFENDLKLYDLKTNYNYNMIYININIHFVMIKLTPYRIIALTKNLVLFKIGAIFKRLNQSPLYSTLT